MNTTLPLPQREDDRLRDAAAALGLACVVYLVCHAQRQMVLAARSRLDATFTIDDAADNLVVNYTPSGQWAIAAVQAFVRAKMCAIAGWMLAALLTTDWKREVLIWHLADPSKVAAWLSENPELPPAEPLQGAGGIASADVFDAIIGTAVAGLYAEGLITSVNVRAIAPAASGDGDLSADRHSQDLESVKEKGRRATGGEYLN